MMARSRLTLLALLLLAGCGSPGPKTDAGPGVPYTVVKEWPVGPHGGRGFGITIEAAHRNEADMVNVARQIESMTRSEAMVYAFFYDDARAAAMSLDLLEDRLSPEDKAYLRRHWIGTYSKSPTGKDHGLNVTLEGIDGPRKQIPF